MVDTLTGLKAISPLSLLPLHKAFVVDVNMSQLEFSFYLFLVCPYRYLTNNFLQIILILLSTQSMEFKTLYNTNGVYAPFQNHL